LKILRTVLREDGGSSQEPEVPPDTVSTKMQTPRGWMYKIFRFERLERKLNQESFAEFVGISVDFLSLIERGINAPSFETIEQMARRLRVPVRVLFEFPDRRPVR
jgi:DNA-binding XRE family transcriptional regulator